MKAAVGVLVRQDATPLPAVAGPSSSNEDDEERSVEWCLEAVKGDDEDAVVEGQASSERRSPQRRTRRGSGTSHVHLHPRRGSSSGYASS